LNYAFGVGLWGKAATDISTTTCNAGWDGISAIFQRMKQQ